MQTVPAGPLVPTMTWLTFLSTTSLLFISGIFAQRRIRMTEIV